MFSKGQADMSSRERAAEVAACSRHGERRDGRDLVEREILGVHRRFFFGSAAGNAFPERRFPWPELAICRLLWHYNKTS